MRESESPPPVWGGAIGRRTAPLSPKGGGAVHFRGGEEGGSENLFPTSWTRLRSGRKEINAKPSHQLTLYVCRGTACPSRQALSLAPYPKVAATAKAGRGAQSSGRAETSGYPP